VGNFYFKSKGIQAGCCLSHTKRRKAVKEGKGGKNIMSFFADEEYIV
jgi:hypothetical protein